MTPPKVTYVAAADLARMTGLTKGRVSQILAQIRKEKGVDLGVSIGPFRVYAEEDVAYFLAYPRRRYRKSD
ncbi:MAG: hypothetical protein O3B13_15200 [Planctomycetota bacterium]|nr:hypothetical protein [Planctomycetota bacterium]